MSDHFTFQIGLEYLYRAYQNDHPFVVLSKAPKTKASVFVVKI